MYLLALEVDSLDDAIATLQSQGRACMWQQVLLGNVSLS